MTGNPKCIKCGGTLELPHPEGQYICEDCGAVVSPDTLQEPKR